MGNKNRKKKNASNSGEDPTPDSTNPTAETEPANDPTPGEVTTDDDSEVTNNCPHVRKYKQPTTENSKGKNRFNATRVCSVKSIKCLTCVSEKTAAIESEDLWFCMHCYETRCGRYSESHGLNHFEIDQSHCLSLSVALWRIWCYQCDRFIAPELVRGKLESSVCLAKKAFKKSAVTVPATSYKNSEVIEFEEIVTQQFRVIGLQNLGNTCYFNSALQNLLYLNTFKRKLDHTLTRTEFCLVPKKHPDLPPITFKYANTSATTPGALTNALSLLIEQTKTGKEPRPSSSKRVNLKKRVCCPREVQQAISKRHKKFSNGSQQDSHELLRFFIDLIKDEEIKRLKAAFLDHFDATNHRKEFKTYSEEKRNLLKKYASEFTNIFVFTGTFIDDVFGGKMLSIVRCHSCSNIFSINEDFLDLSLSLPVEKHSSSQKNQAKPVTKKKEKQINKAMEKAKKNEKKKGKTQREKSQVDEYELACLTKVNCKPEEDTKVSEEKGTATTDKSGERMELNVEPDNQQNDNKVSEEKGTSTTDKSGERMEFSGEPDNQQNDNKVSEEKGTATTDKSGERMEFSGEPDNQQNDNEVSEEKGTSTTDKSGERMEFSGEPDNQQNDNKVSEEKGTSTTDKSGERMEFSGEPDNQQNNNKVSEEKGTSTTDKSGERMEFSGEPDNQQNDNEVSEEKDTATTDKSGERMELNVEPDNNLNNCVDGLNLQTQDTSLSKVAVEKDNSVDTTPDLDREVVPEIESNDTDKQDVDSEIPSTNSVTNALTNSLPDSNMEVEQASPESVPSRDDTGVIVKPKDILRLTYPKPPPRDSLEHFITRFFSAEVLEGDYLCTNCNPQLAPAPEDEKAGGDGEGEGTDEKEGSQESIDLSKCHFSDATKQFHIKHLPPIFTIHLKRFSQIGNRLQKINKQIDFPLVLDMSPYCTDDTPVAKDSDNNIMYGLRGIVNHSGGMIAGHYIAYVNIADWGNQPTPDMMDVDTCSGECAMEVSSEASDPLKTTTSPITHPHALHEPSMHVKPTEEWYYISDSHVSRVSSDEVFKTQAYILFYERLPIIVSK